MSGGALLKSRILVVSIAILLTGIVGGYLWTRPNSAGTTTLEPPAVSEPVMSAANRPSVRPSRTISSVTRSPSDHSGVVKNDQLKSTSPQRLPPSLKRSLSPNQTGLRNASDRSGKRFPSASGLRKALKQPDNPHTWLDLAKDYAREGRSVDLIKSALKRGRHYSTTDANKAAFDQMIDSCDKGAVRFVGLPDPVPVPVGKSKSLVPAQPRKK